jgi:molecular chaperone Hsp33
MLLGSNELKDMIKTQHGADVHCNFCNQHYVFSEDDLTRLVTELVAH